jgi:hypothetical protein
MQLDDWVLCRIYKKTSQVSPMLVPPLADHELDEPSGGAYPMSSAGMLVQAGASSYPIQAGMQRMPKIPSISELLNEYSLTQLFDDGGHGEMARHEHHGAALLGHPIMNQFHVNSSMSQLAQMDSSASTSAAGEGAPGKRKRSTEDGGGHNGSTSQPDKKPNGSCFGAPTYRVGSGSGNGNALQGSLVTGHQTLLHF